MVASGAAIAQAITMLFAPIVTRIYDPEAFGILGAFMAIVSIITPVAALAYPIAIVLPKEREEAKKLVIISLWLIVCVSAIMLALVIGAVFSLNLQSDVHGLNKIVILFPFGIFVISLYEVAHHWIIREKKFSLFATTTIANALFQNFLKVSVGLLAASGSVLILIATVGSGLQSLVLYLFRGKKQNKNSKSKRLYTLSELCVVAKKYSDFPKYRAPQLLINASSQGLPILILASLFGAPVAGFYTLGKTVLAVPSQIIGKAIGDVFYPKITENVNAGKEILNHVIKATLALTIMGVPIFGAIILMGPEIFKFAFGDTWEESGTYAQWMSLWMFFIFINTPSVRTTPVINAQKWHLYFTISSILVRLGSLVGSYYITESPIITVATFCVSGAVMNSILIAVLLRKCLKYDLHRRDLH